MNREPRFENLAIWLGVVYCAAVIVWQVAIHLGAK
jgi:hypothetical protein